MTMATFVRVQGADRRPKTIFFTTIGSQRPTTMGSLARKATRAALGAGEISHEQSRLMMNQISSIFISAASEILK